MEIIETFAEFKVGRKQNKVKEFSKDFLFQLIALSRNISPQKKSISFPFYHHVFNDERKGFHRQLKYLKKFGEFISMDDATELIKGNVPFNGRYFCLTFDDGVRNCYNNMMPITTELNVPVMIYLPTDYIGLDENNAEDVKMLKANRPENPKLVSFLNWIQCREMLQHKVTFGSHTKSHIKMLDLNATEQEFELSASKTKIEYELKRECKHFACPWGKEHLHFNPAVTVPILKKLGYESLVTTHRGDNNTDSNLFAIKRDHLLANWGNHHLKYFFGN